jgi:hypothetical protein
VGNIQDQINDADGVIFAVYTNMGQPMAIEQAFEYIGPYVDGSYFTGQAPPISMPFTPYTAVLDMETMEVLDMETGSYYMTTADILTAVNGAGD